MSSASNDRGRAYEYAFLTALHEAIAEHRDVYIVDNSQYRAARGAWERVDEPMRGLLRLGSVSAVSTLFDLEPLILEDNGDVLELMIQPDATGAGGDVRDILIIRRDVRWEVGLSMKHNHFAAKHSRVSGTIDFGEKWYGVPCSREYWAEIRPIFDDLREKKASRMLWRDIGDKNEQYYVPVLQAFIEEVKRAYDAHPEIPRRLVEYFLGQYDFYKVVSVDRQRVTQIQTFNLRGTLNRPGERRAIIQIPQTHLPTRMIQVGMKPSSTTTVEMYLDNGWTFSFRIHSASSKVEDSLKFDIQIVGVPTTIMTINCSWV